MTYYQATLGALESKGPPLDGALECDTCIVGAGFAGLNAALGLVQRQQRDIVMLEATALGSGASGRNGGFVFGGYSLDENGLYRQAKAQASPLYRRTLDAVQLIASRIEAIGIDCDRVDGGVIWANWFRDPSILQRRQRLLRETYGVQWDYWSAARLREQVDSPRYHDALFEAGAFHFHPLKYLHGLAAHLRSAHAVQIFENSPAISIRRRGESWRVDTPTGSVTCRTLILSCGGYLARLNARVDAAVLPIATYVMCTETCAEQLDAAGLRSHAAIYDTRFAFDYYRRLRDGRLLWGGRISIRDRNPQAVQRLLRKDMLKVFPALHRVRIEYAWSGWMSYARHAMPQLAQVEPNLWVTQAFGGHGIAPTTAMGELLAATIVAQRAGRALPADFLALQNFGLGSTHKPWGLLAAQLQYWWMQGRDWLQA